MSSSSYFNWIQSYQHLDCNVPNGLNIYSFGLHPQIIQPTGSCNMSQIDDVKIQMQLSYAVNINLPASFRAYALCYNVFRVSNGLAGLVFT